MRANDPGIARRMEWMRMYEESRDVPSICRRFSISRKTFYKWLKRYRKSSQDLSSLGDRSRRPHHSPRATSPAIVQRLRELREKTGFGQKRLKLYLSIWYDIDLSESAIWKLLKRSGVDMKLKKSQRRKVRPNDALLPGDRVILTFKFIPEGGGAQRLVQYSAIDECTRLRITRIYGRHSTLSALDFVQFVLMHFPFVIRYVQTPLDNAFASVAKPRSRTHAFTMNLRKLGIKHEVPSKKRLAVNRFLERIKRFDEVEPYCSKPFTSPDELQQEAARYLYRYNNERPIPLIENLSPVEKLRTYQQFSSLQRFDPYNIA
ncbi:MAG TPA: leucine zipper domain-containing protein [Bacteroidota bacterium]|nr:leucine zipper domain-containing protein [Bacteroidota bacterium]